MEFGNLEFYGEVRKFSYSDRVDLPGEYFLRDCRIFKIALRVGGKWEILLERILLVGGNLRRKRVVTTPRNSWNAM